MSSGRAAPRSRTRPPRWPGDIIASMPSYSVLAKTSWLGRLCAKMFAIGFFCALLGLPALAQDAACQPDLLAWRAQHVADLLRPYGWLSLARLRRLPPGDISAGSATDHKMPLPAGPRHHNARPAHLRLLAT